MADLIDRQAVVNVICEMHVGGQDAVKNALPNTYGADLREIIEEIDALPSAQPERCEDCVNFSKTRLLIPQSEIIRCKDCKHSYETFAGLICSHGVCVDCVVRDDFYCSYGERNDVRRI